MPADDGLMQMSSYAAAASGRKTVRVSVVQRVSAILADCPAIENANSELHVSVQISGDTQDGVISWASIFGRCRLNDDVVIRALSEVHNYCRGEEGLERLVASLGDGRQAHHVGAYVTGDSPSPHLGTTRDSREAAASATAWASAGVAATAAEAAKAAAAASTTKAPAAAAPAAAVTATAVAADAAAGAPAAAPPALSTMVATPAGVDAEQGVVAAAAGGVAAAPVGAAAAPVGTAALAATAAARAGAAAEPSAEETQNVAHSTGSSQGSGRDNADADASASPPAAAAHGTGDSAASMPMLSDSNIASADTVTLGKRFHRDLSMEANVSKEALAKVKAPEGVPLSLFGMGAWRVRPPILESPEAPLKVVPCAETLAFMESAMVAAVVSLTRSARCSIQLCPSS